MHKLSVRGMGLSFGVLWAILTLVVGFTAMHGWGARYVDVMSSFYMGYNTTFMGAFIGAVWAFFTGLLSGALFAYFYNRFGGE